MRVYGALNFRFEPDEPPELLQVILETLLAAPRSSSSYRNVHFGLVLVRSDPEEKKGLAGDDQLVSAHPKNPDEFERTTYLLEIEIALASGPILLNYQAPDLNP